MTHKILYDLLPHYLPLLFYFLVLFLALFGPVTLAILLFFKTQHMNFSESLIMLLYSYETIGIHIYETQHPGMA